MNQKLNLVPSESIDVDCDEESSDDKKKIPICERCWIFKKNKDFIQRKCSRGRGSPNDYNVDVNRYDDHKRFLAHLIEFQQSLPHEKMGKPVVVNQVASDSADIKNIFVNNTIRPNYNINLKAITETANKKKEQSNVNILSNRSLRLNRKCKVNKSMRDECDDDLLFLGKNTRSTRQDEVNKNKDICINNGEVENTAHSRKVILQAEENPSNPLDELLGDTGFAPVKNKKRRVEVQGNTFMSDIRNMTKQFISKIPLGEKSFATKTVNGHGEDEDDTSNNVIEIDGESGEKEATSNKEETNKTSKVSCPMCSKLFSPEEINNHAYTCQGPQTLTRGQQSKKDSQENLSVNYSATAWVSACKGLDTDTSEVSKKQKNPVEHVDLVSETNMFGDNAGRTKSIYSKQNNFKIPEDQLADVKVSSKVKYEPKNEKLQDDKQIRHRENKPNRLTAKLSGYKNLAHTHNQSTQDLIESYAKTIHKMNKNPPAKQMRSFGEHHNEHEMVKCARCDQYVADDLLKAHTDHCLEKSMLIE